MGRRNPEPTTMPRPWRECEVALEAGPCELACRHRLHHGGESCALAVAERGPLRLIDVGALLGVTRERVRQVEAAALVKLRARLRAMNVEIDGLAEPVSPWDAVGEGDADAA